MKKDKRNEFFLGGSTVLLLILYTVLCVVTIHMIQYGNYIGIVFTAVLAAAGFAVYRFVLSYYARKMKDRTDEDEKDKI